ncbi:MAG: hypothetical protein U0X91_09300 [Spirosomataceae bacterium]
MIKRPLSLFQHLIGHFASLGRTMVSLAVGGLLVISIINCQSPKANQRASVTELPQRIPLCNGALTTLKELSDLPIPIFREKIGNSHLLITTANKEAQRWFDLGLNHLHGFWHLEAYRAFRRVIQLDSNCAMGYWGMAMCRPGFGGDDNLPWEALIDKAIGCSNRISPLEKDLIAASEQLIKQGLSLATVERFRTLYKTYPDEPEAIAFASILLRQHENETTQQEVKLLLERAMQRFPDNVAFMHYYVHVMELRQEFRQALPIAEKMALLAPNAPHLVHMPGHLYFLAGEYDKALKAYNAAKKQETTYHLSEKIPFSANQNYIHNLHFLAVTQAEMADYAGALATAGTISNLSLSTALPNEGAALMIHYEGRILPALVHIRFRKWPEAAAHVDKLLNSLDLPVRNTLVQKYFQVMRLYCLGMEAVTEGRVQEGMQYGGELSQLMQQFEQEGTARRQSSEFKSINETYDIMSMARYELAGWIDNLDKTQPFNDAAWKEALSLQNAIKYDEPPRLMYPIEESKARLHLYRGELSAYEIAKRAALLKRPNSTLIKTTLANPYNQL